MERKYLGGLSMALPLSQLLLLLLLSLLSLAPPILLVRIALPVVAAEPKCCGYRRIVHLSVIGLPAAKAPTAAAVAAGDRLLRAIAAAVATSADADNVDGAVVS